MEAKEFIELFDSCWFEMEIFKKQSCLSKSLGVDANPDHRNQEEAPKSELYRVPTIISRSMSDELWPKTRFGSDLSLSPDSVLLTPKLHTILSSKEITEEEGANLMSIQTQRVYVKETPTIKSRSRRRAKKKLSKSLSELEFEELKGFMDLGFVFSEEDKDSSLVSIIPGLQRLGKKEGEENGGVDEATVSRPYLSEAWNDLERRKKEDPLVNWRIPASSNEMDIKDNLKWWAQTVASTVR
ncbi:uncharacterized protein LOC110604488 [Manihot esculenta]|uniref:DUF1685 domain-containing protein n=1 Tax=Manihot esculenta TaxID=3983 RepID=A0A2C9U5D2_MANES|nr:uncharacterized protein LOC110604488 [Manihot esculenta]OAY24979.1 hypothetical protein MANES_17G058500v8 [Manihot esculenta]